MQVSHRWSFIFGRSVVGAGGLWWGGGSPKTAKDAAALGRGVLRVFSVC
jgi:hypothetical protein